MILLILQHGYVVVQYCIQVVLEVCKSVRCDGRNRCIACVPNRVDGTFALPGQGQGVLAGCHAFMHARSLVHSRQPVVGTHPEALDTSLQPESRVLS